MGLFDMIANQRHNLNIKKEEIRNRIKDDSLTGACHEIANRLPSASLPMKARLTDLIREKINSTESERELVDAFEETFEYRNRRNGFWYLNISQMIGQKLDSMNSRYVEVEENENGKNIYKPSY